MIDLQRIVTKQKTEIKIIVPEFQEIKERLGTIESIQAILKKKIATEAEFEKWTEQAKFLFLSQDQKKILKDKYLLAQDYEI